MTSIALALALVSAAQFPPHRARRIAQVCRPAEIKYALPAGLLAAVAWHESGGRYIEVSEGKAGCGVGPWMLLIPGCYGTIRYVMRRAPLSAHAGAAARLLSRSRKKCQGTKPPAYCARCVWGYYNAGSRTWCGRVLKKLETIRAAAAAAPSS